MAFGKDRPEALHTSIGDTVLIVERSFILDIGSSILQLQLVTKNENLHSFNVLNLHLILSFLSCFCDSVGCPLAVTGIT